MQGLWLWQESQEAQGRGVLLVVPQPVLVHLPTCEKHAKGHMDPLDRGQQKGGDVFRPDLSLCSPSGARKKRNFMIMSVWMHALYFTPTHAHEHARVMVFNLYPVGMKVAVMQAGDQASSWMLRGQIRNGKQGVGLLLMTSLQIGHTTTHAKLL